MTNEKQLALDITIHLCTDCGPRTFDEIVALLSSLEAQRQEDVRAVVSAVRELAETECVDTNAFARGSQFGTDLALAAAVAEAGKRGVKV